MVPPESSPASGLRVFVLAAALLTLFAWSALRVARETSATFDEPGFMAAGVSYLTPGSPEIATSNLRLAQLWLAAPLLPLQPKLPDIVARQPGLITGADSDLGRLFLADARNDGPALLRRSRAANTLLGVALGAVLFAWSRRLHGDTAGLLTLAFYCLNPLVLAHSALATTDIAVTLALVTATWCAWRLMQKVTATTVLAAGLATGALLATKFSGLLLLPIAVTMATVQLVRSPSRGSDGKRMIIGASATGVMAYAVIWAVFGFRFSAGAPLGAEAWAAGDSSAHSIISWLHDCRLLPEAYLADLRDFLAASGYRRAFLLGEHSLDGWWYFFPLVWFFKMPLPLQLTLLLGLFALWKIWRARKTDPASALALHALIPLLALGLIYATATMAGRLNIGLRHWLPVCAVTFVVAGAAMRLPWPPALRTAVITALLGWSAVNAWQASAHPLAFTNALGGGTDRGYRVAVDSSYEWGQNLPALEHWLAARAARPGEKPPVYFSYFGNADLRRFKLDAILLPQFFDLRAPAGYPLGPGTYVISATMLQSVYGEINGPWRPSLERAYQEHLAAMQRLETQAQNRATLDQFLAQDGVTVWQQRLRTYDWLRFGRLCAWLRQRVPHSRVTPGLLVYELTAENLRDAQFGPPAELRTDDAIKGTRAIPQEQLDFRK